MATKGASFRFGSTRGGYSKSNPRGVNYQWAKDFNKNTLDKHFKEHGKEFGLSSKESYRQHAIKFANTVDNKNNQSYVDKNGTTYKFNKQTNALAIVNKQGIIISYHVVSNKFHYIDKEGVKKWVYVKKK